MTVSHLEKLTSHLLNSNLDAIALNPGPALVYLTGAHFHLMERPIVYLVAPGLQPVIILPELEMLKVEQIPYPVQAFPYGENPLEWDKSFRGAAQALGLDGKRIGVETRRLRLLEFNYLRNNFLASEILDADELLGSLRLRKDPAEIASMRKAVKVAQAALEDALPLIRIGMTEKELASELVGKLLQHGSEPELPFFPIVSGGPNAANPHAAPSERKLQVGDLLVVDWGASVDGYISDLTRTFAVGHVDAEFENIHRVVQAANAAGRAAGKPGVPCAAVDLAAREVIEEAGYGKYFNHRTGHGIGMEPHEEPYIRNDNQQLLEMGMTYTVEPGIYLAGKNGVRVEDNVVVTEKGCECLSDMPREMRVVG